MNWKKINSKKYLENQEHNYPNNQHQQIKTLTSESGWGSGRIEFGLAEDTVKSLNGTLATERRLLSCSQGNNLIKQGFRAADLHVHTYYSYDVAPAKEVDPLVIYHKARARGMSFISFTDHDTMDAYNRIGWTREDIITGVEVKILDKKRIGHTVHLNVYTLNKQQFKKIQEIVIGRADIEMLIEYLRAEKLPYVFNHPFWHEPGEKLNAEVVVEIAELFSVLEYNMGRIGKLNRMVLRLAELKSMGIVAGSDSHTGEIGKIYTLARGDSFEEFFASVTNGNSFLVVEDLNYARIKQEIIKRLAMLMERGNWMVQKDEMKVDSGNALVDQVIRVLSSNGAGLGKLKKTLTGLLASLVARTGLPARIYLKKQNKLAIRLEQELGLA